MKKIAVLVLILLAFMSVAFAEASFSTDEMSIRLPDRWYGLSLLNPNCDASFISQDSSLMISVHESFGFLQGIGDVSVTELVYNVLDRDTLEPVLETMLKEQISIYADEVEVKTAELPDGIINCYCVISIDGSPCAVAFTVSGKDMWMLLCSSTAPSVDVETLLLEAMNGLELLNLNTDPNKAADVRSETVATVNDGSGYSIPEVPMIVHVSEDAMNVYTPDTPADSLTMSRTAYAKSQTDAYIQGIGASLVITPKEDPKLNFCIQIRVKDNKYPELRSWTDISLEEVDPLIRMMYGNELSDYELDRTANATYADLKLTFDKENTVRYATIQNGDMIYIQGTKENGVLTPKDIELFQKVVNSIEYTAQ